jgi:hypothetical protein
MVELTEPTVGGRRFGWINDAPRGTSGNEGTTTQHTSFSIAERSIAFSTMKH